MTVAVQAPNRRKDPLDLIQQGLQIAASIYGIKADMAKMDEYQANKKAAQDKQTADLELTRAQTKALANKPTQQEKYRDIKVIGPDNRATILSLKESEPVPSGYRPYEEPKSPKDNAFAEEKRLDDIKTEAGRKFERSGDKYKEAYFKGKNVEALLNTGTPTAVSAAATQFMKLSGEVGAITDGDIKRFGGSQDLISQAQRIIEKGSTGKLLPEDIAAMKDAARVLTEKNKIAFLAEADQIASSTAKGYRGVNETDIREFLGARDLLTRMDKDIVDQLRSSSEGVANALSPNRFFSPQGRPFQQQERGNQVQRSWGQRLGGEAAAAPTPQASQPFSPQDYLRSR